MEKYLFEENGFVYKLDNNEIYNLIYYIPPHDFSPYAKAKLEYMKEHQPEYVLELLAEDKLISFLENYEVEQRKLEIELCSKSKHQDKMSQMMIRECLMYQDLT